MIRSLQACRAAAALLVVLLHTSRGIFALPKYFDCKPLGEVFYFGTAGVDFFFVLSGFLIAHVHGGDVGRPGRLRAYLWKRLTRVYPAYWAALLPLIPVFFLAPHLGMGPEREPSVILSSLLLLPRLDTAFVLGVAWSLPYELFFYALFAALIASRRWGAVVCGAWLALVAVAVVDPFVAGPWAFVASLYHLHFLGGVLLALALKRGTVPAPRLVAVAGAAVFLAAGMFDVYVRPLGAHGRVVGYTTGSVLILAGLIEAERSGRLRVPGPLVFLGDASYSIYLVHFPALSVMAKVVKAVHLDAWVPAPLLFGLLAGGSVLAGCVFHLAIERPLLRLLRGPHPTASRVPEAPTVRWWRTGGPAVPASVPEDARQEARQAAA
jgi:peptidoglycan/LPS O-acetylase OafA/YrhL